MNIDEVKSENNEKPELLIKETNKANLKLKLDLNLIRDNEVSLADNNSEEEEESLRFDKSYKPFLSDCTNLKLKEQNNPNYYRKTSTISTTISYSESGHDVLNQRNNHTSSEEKKDSSSSSHILFSRERFYSTPISNYYDGTDNYFKGLHPEKNDYQKSNNYLEKQKYIRDHLPSIDLINYNEEDINISNEISPKLSADLNNISPITFNLPKTPQAKTQSINAQNNLNKNNGKYDYPIYYFGYYSFDCKSKINK